MAMVLLGTGTDRIIAITKDGSTPPTRVYRGEVQEVTEDEYTEMLEQLEQQAMGSKHQKSNRSDTLTKRVKRLQLERDALMVQLQAAEDAAAAAEKEAMELELEVANALAVKRQEKAQQLRLQANALDDSIEQTTDAISDAKTAETEDAKAKAKQKAEDAKAKAKKDAEQAAAAAKVKQAADDAAAGAGGNVGELSAEEIAANITALKADHTEDTIKELGYTELRNLAKGVAVSGKGKKEEIQVEVIKLLSDEPATDDDQSPPATDDATQDADQAAAGNQSPATDDDKTPDATQSTVTE